MNKTYWMSTILLMALGGCSTHTPISESQPKPFPSLTKIDANQSALTDPFCCMLPQDLDVKLPEYGPKINDLERFEQSMAPYVEQNSADKENLLDIQLTFDERYYSPWSYTLAPQKVQEVTWPLRAFRGGYGNNLLPVSPSWFEGMKNQSNFEAYGSINKKAVTLKWMDIRAFPTAKPLYKDPSKAGDGYPFDLLQNSSVNYNEPIFVSHTSKDGAWSYIFTNNASGWVPSEGVSMLDDATALSIKKSEKLFITEDNIALYDAANRFVAYSRVGMVLPLEKEEGEFYFVKAVDANGAIKILSLPKHAAHIGVSRFTKSDLISIGNQMLKNTYGWGGMYGERDCSSMIRDFMTPFGIMLPRNSSSQAKKGEVISFSGMSNEQKLSLIKEQGIPFETIVYLKGHVLLYVGTYQDNVMVMHNFWGVRTLDKSGNKGRHIIGKAIISTLEIGSELEEYDSSMKLLSRVESMNIFTKTAAPLARQSKSIAAKKPL
jgi:hypothetical protein